MPLQKFASEIFIPHHQADYAAVQNEIHLFVRGAVKPATDQQLQGRLCGAIRLKPNWVQLGNPNKQLVSDLGSHEEAA